MQGIYIVANDKVTENAIAFFLHQILLSNGKESREIILLGEQI